MKNLRVESHGGTIPYCWRGRKQLNIRLNQQQANQENPLAAFNSNQQACWRLKKVSKVMQMMAKRPRNL
jgi:hypothetical protein